MTGAELLEQVLALARRARLLLDEDGLTIRRYQALSALAERPLRVGELAAAVEVRTPSAVSLVDALEREGLVRRLPDRLDRRVSVVELTAAGRRRRTQAERRLLDAFDALAAAPEQRPLSRRSATSG